MKAFCGSALACAGLPMLLLSASPARAQVEESIVLDILRQCARIDDATARLACFDNNIRNAGAPARSSVPGRMDAPQGGRGAPIADSDAPQEFGREVPRAPETTVTRDSLGEIDELTARVASVSTRGPGLYVVTLEGGARWEFLDGVPQSYRPPRAGSSVEIERASMGSFLMRFNNQRSVRVRRID